MIKPYAVQIDGFRCAAQDCGTYLWLIIDDGSKGYGVDDWKKVETIPVYHTSEVNTLRPPRGWNEALLNQRFKEEIATFKRGY